MGAPYADSPVNHPLATAAGVALSVPDSRYAAILARLRAARPAVATEALLLAAAVYLTVVCNGPLWRELLAGRPVGAPSTWGFAIAVGAACASATFVMLALVSPRLLVKPLLSFLLLATAAAVHFMGDYGVVLDTSMLRNLLHTDVPEARELIGRDLLLALATYALVPIALLWWPRLKRSSPRRAITRRLLAICGAWLLAVAALLPVYRDLASVVRNKPELRHLLTPENYLVALGKALFQDTRRASLARLPIGEDARLASAWEARTRPVLLVLVVGETVRADHFSLNGYARETTPELERLGVVNFSDVSSCGTATEVSLPCMFSEVGRNDYDGDRIHREEGLLNVLARTGLRVLWRDNQSGCKGVCEGTGIEFQSVRNLHVPGLCTAEGCLDEILVHDLESTVSADSRSQVIVMHMLGNHGPSYFSRYPDRFRRFLPTCDTGELRQCTREQIINSYDNALTYTDHVLAETIAFLKSKSDRYDTLLLYVSDHGESLGEHGLYLHGMPYAIAPREQTHVPMVAWFSPEFERSAGLDEACVRGISANPASHDNLFHSVLGLLDVQTSVYQADLDLFAGCRSQVAVARR
jgi:lipid A ethanolaminephosphotransferase